jgi:hypothetical protein
MGKIDLLRILKILLKTLTLFKHIFLCEWSDGEKKLIFKLEELKGILEHCQLYLFWNYLTKLSTTQNYITLNDWMVMNNELEGMCREATVALFKIPSRYLLGGTEENCENLSQDSLWPGRGSNKAPPDYNWVSQSARRYCRLNS